MQKARMNSFIKNTTIRYFHVSKFSWMLLFLLGLVLMTRSVSAHRSINSPVLSHSNEAKVLSRKLIHSGTYNLENKREWKSLRRVPSTFIKSVRTTLNAHISKVNDKQDRSQYDTREEHSVKYHNFDKDSRADTTMESFVAILSPV